MDKKFILTLSLTAILAWASEELLADPLSKCEKNCNRAHSSIYQTQNKHILEQELHAWELCMRKCEYVTPLSDDEYGTSLRDDYEYGTPLSDD